MLPSRLLSIWAQDKKGTPKKGTPKKGTPMSSLRRTTKRQLLAGMAGVSLLTLVGTAALAEESILGATWLAEDIKGKGVIDNLQTTLAVSRDGTVSGLAGCNRFSGTPTIKGQSITFGPMAVTRMACLPAVAEQEDRFLAALGETALYRFDGSYLLFQNAEGETVVRFTDLTP